MASYPNDQSNAAGATPVWSAAANLSANPAVDMALYAQGDALCDKVTLNLPRTGPGILTALGVKFAGGGTTAVTMYVFGADPTASTITKNAPFVLAAADLDKLVCAPQVLTPAVAGVGTTVTFAEAANMARAFSVTDKLYIAVVINSAFNPASATDLHLNVEVTQ